jgi:N-acetylglucosamine-6-phosphate deacetylase
VEGKDADIVMFDKDINVILTMVEGKVVYSKDKIF